MPSLLAPKKKENAEEEQKATGQKRSPFKKFSLRGRGKAPKHTENLPADHANNEEEAHISTPLADSPQKLKKTTKQRTPLRMSLRGKSKRKEETSEHIGAPVSNAENSDFSAKSREADGKDTEAKTPLWTSLRGKGKANDKTQTLLPHTTHVNLPTALASAERQDTVQTETAHRPRMYPTRKRIDVKEIQTTHKSDVEVEVEAAEQMIISRRPTLYAKGTWKSRDKNKEHQQIYLANDKTLDRLPLAAKEKQIVEKPHDPLSDEADFNHSTISPKGKGNTPDRTNIALIDHQNSDNPVVSAKDKEKASDQVKVSFTNAEILRKIRFERFQIAAAGELFHSYRDLELINMNRFKMQPGFNAMIRMIVPNPDDVEGLETVDTVLVASYLFPEAELRELSTVTQCLLWTFLLSNQLHPLNQEDYFSFKDIRPGWVKGKRMDPVKVSTYLEKALGIDTEQESHIEVSHPHTIMEIFDKIRDEMKDGCRGAQLSLFVDEVENLMIQAQREHNMIDRLIIPTMEECRIIRRAVPAGAGACSIVLSLVPYAARLRVHRKMTDVPLVKTLWDATLEIVWLTNDLVGWSLKEGADLFSNAIVVYMKEAKCAKLQTAADEVYDLLRLSICSFEQYAVELMSQRRHYSMSQKEVTIIVDGFRNVFVGNYRWITQFVDSQL